MLSCRDVGHGMAITIIKKPYSLSPDIISLKDRLDPFLNTPIAKRMAEIVHNLKLSHPSTRSTQNTLPEVWIQAAQSHKKWSNLLNSAIACIAKQISVAPLTHSLRCAPMAKMITILKLISTGNYKCIRQSLLRITLGHLRAAKIRNKHLRNCIHGHLEQRGIHTTTNSAKTFLRTHAMRTRIREGHYPPIPSSHQHSSCPIPTGQCTRCDTSTHNTHQRCSACRMCATCAGLFVCPYVPLTIFKGLAPIL